ncbi:MAG: hypothetical protein JNN05_10000 [Candidatus Omnitrophica bacterium]|nr:hypothetical protein [Candidatus Omnitrophota bacterium]
MTQSRAYKIWPTSLSSEAISLAALGCVVLFLSIQLTALLAMIYALIPIKLDPLAYRMFPLFQDQIRPEREMRFFIIFILFNLTAQAVAVVALKKKMSDPQWRQGLFAFLGMELFWVVAIIFAAFKFFLFGYPAWARVMLWVILAGMVVTKIFFVELCALLRTLYHWVNAHRHDHLFKQVCDGAVVAGIGLAIFIPDVQNALARIYQWDQFFHIDMFVMSAALARTTGAVLNIDVISLYSVVLPAIFGKLMSVTGGLSYERLLTLMMWCGIAYYIVCYAILRTWFKSIVVAAIGVIFIIHMQMFQVGVWPLMWRYPSVTPLRHLLDLAAVFFILRHAQSFRGHFLWLASVACGAMTAYMIDVGIQLTLAFYAYLFLNFVLPDGRTVLQRWKAEAFRLLGLAIVPWLTAGLVLWMFQGNSIFSARFWGGISEYLSIFLSGWGSLPITDAIKDKQFFAFVLGLVIPAVYVWTLMSTGALLWFGRRERREMFLVFLCVYGLASYHYYLGRSASTSYSAVIVPFIYVFCYWLNLVWKNVPRSWKFPAGFAATIVAALALGTNFLFTNYPNMLNLSQSDWRPEKQAYLTQMDVSKDAQMIRELVSQSQQAAVISSFETKILMAANRRPFFYFFPLIESVNFAENRFRGTSMYTRPRLARTLEKFEQEKPQYVFVETKLLTRQISPEFYERFETLRTLLEYVQSHYVVERQGQYLTALKRK